MGFYGCIPRLLGRLRPYAGWILSGMGTVGFIGTVILVNQEAPKAKELMEFEERHDSNLTKLEKVEIAIPCYIPSILTGLFTMGCFWGAQVFNARTQASLMLTIGALTTQFEQYRDAIRAEYGDEADKKAYILSQKQVKELEAEIKRLKEENGPFLYEFASLPGIVFEEKPGDLSNALMHFNRNMLLKGQNDLRELYNFVGLPEDVYDKDEAGAYGWQEYENEVGFGVAYVDFMFVRKVNADGREVNIISTYVPPYEIDVDYGFEGNVEDHIYPGYNIDMAEKYAEQTTADEIVQVKKDWVVRALTYPSVIF